VRPDTLNRYRIDLAAARSIEIAVPLARHYRCLDELPLQQDE